jgi:hypothetical protein
MLIQHLHRDVPESGLVGCCQYDRRCNHGFQGLFPAKGAEAPAVTGFKAWKPELGARRTEVVAPRSDYNALKWGKKAKANFTVKGRWRF